MKVLAILRAEVFSPNSVEKDRAIMMAVVRLLEERGYEVDVVREEELKTVEADVVLSMGRLAETLAMLKQTEAMVINTAESVERCGRSELALVMERLGIPVPPLTGEHGYWLKRGDMAAQTEQDVTYAGDEQVLEEKIAMFRQRGVKDYTVSAHVDGDVVKFYGVRDTGFFRYYYPSDDGVSKFGHERQNGQAHHYPFSVAAMRQDSERLAETIGISVYGGDCIVREDGTYCMIDFNDWPSFSRCCEEAAEAIVSLI